MTERVEYTKRTAILGKTHVQQSFFHKRELTELFAAHDTPDLPTPFPYSKQSRNCDASSNFIDCNPQKARRRKFRQQRSAHLCATQKAKVDSPLTRTADCFPSSNKALKKKGVTLPPQRDHVRTEGFLYWL